MKNAQVNAGIAAIAVCSYINARSSSSMIAQTGLYALYIPSGRLPAGNTPGREKSKYINHVVMILLRTGMIRIDDSIYLIIKSAVKIHHGNR